MKQLLHPPPTHTFSFFKNFKKTKKRKGNLKKKGKEKELK